MYVTRRRSGLRGLGDASACGDNPCSAWDLTAGILMPWVMSASCEAYLVCAGTGGALTPAPSQFAILPTSANTGNGGGVQAAQAACESAGNTWNPLTGTCTPQFMTYVPWLVAGLAAFVVLPNLMGRR